MKKFRLTRCVVAQLPLCVLSPYALAHADWETRLSSENASSCLKLRDLRVSLNLDDRSWWCLAFDGAGSKKQQGRQSQKHDSPVRMEVDSMTTTPVRSPTISDTQILPKSVLKVKKEPLKDPQKASSDSSQVFASRLMNMSDVHLEQGVRGQKVEPQSTACLSEQVVRGQKVEFQSTATRPSIGNQPGRAQHGVQSAGRLQFLVRGLTDQMCETSENSLGKALGVQDSELEFHECGEVESHQTEYFYIGDVETELVWIGDDGEDVPLPGFEEGQDLLDEAERQDEEDGQDLDPIEDEQGPDLSEIDLFHHLSRGHTPYLPSCQACVRSAGRLPARRLKSRRNRNAVASDFCFLGQVKWLVLLVVQTGMILSMQMHPTNYVANIRQLNRLFKEAGLTGKQMELVSDSEAALQSLFRNAVKAEGCPVTGLSSFPTARGRSQQNGLAERAVQTFKQLIGSNIFSLEQQLGIRIPLESELLRHLGPYVYRSYNIHHIKEGSETTPLEKLRGVKRKKPKTLPFGSLVLGKGAPSAEIRELEHLSPAIYLGPINSTGGGFFGILAGAGRIGVEDPDKVRVFNAGRVVTPCSWPVEDIQRLCIKAKGSPALAGPPPVVNPDGNEGIDEPYVADDMKGPPSSLIVPASGPPKRWVEEYGPTAGCSACERIKNTGRSHARGHSSSCKRRYLEYLEKQNLAEKKRQTMPPPSAPAAPSTGPEGSGSTAAPPPPGSPSGGRSPAPMEIEPDPVNMPPESDGMDIGQLLDCILEQMFAEENHFLRRIPKAVGSGGETIWVQIHCLGKELWQAISTREPCENTGSILDVKQLETAIRREFSQFEALQLGAWKTESEAQKHAHMSGNKVLTSRWVHVQKTPELTRSRVVAKDFRSTGLSSLRENLYSPTPNLESLRTALSWYGWSIHTIDISTAFLFANLLPAEQQCIALPTGTVDVHGQRVHLLLKRALYGLRRAPLAWHRELKNHLLSLGAEETSEATILRVSRDTGMILVICYVDDCVLLGESKGCLEVIQWLSEKYQVKLTGSILKGEPGRLEYLGRVIEREVSGGPLLIGLPPSYYDSIVEAAELDVVKPLASPPKLVKYLEGGDSELTEVEKKRFRSTLGRLAWFALTAPPLAFQVSFVSCYQSNPTKNGWEALKDVLRYAKNFKGCSQYIGQSDWGQSVEQVSVVVDASWSTRSVMGGLCFVGGTMVKCFSRRIQTVCLSSCEAELHALVEGAHESLAIALMTETFQKGLPSCDALGLHKSVEGTFAVEMHSDSEAAIAVGNMSGLLRKVRHVELRALRLQQLVESGRLRLNFVRAMRIQQIF